MNVSISNFRFRYLTIVAGSLLATFSAQAGTIYFQSASYISNGPPVSTANVSASSGASISGKSFDLYLDAISIGKQYGTVAGTAGGLVSVQYKVKWVESYPGEPKPSGLSATWDCTRDNSIDWHFFTGAGSLNVILACTPDPQSFNANETRTATDHFIHTSSTLETVYGGFDFADEGGEWIGTGTFTITMTMGAGGSVQPNGVSWNTHDYCKLLLKKVGTMTVL